MAIKLQDKPNVSPPDADYPYGNIKDNTGSSNGTPVNKLVYADFHQFFARMLAVGGVVANGLPDNNANGFQYFTALQNIIQAYINALVDSAPGFLDTLNELSAAIGDDANFAATMTTALAGKIPNSAGSVSTSNIANGAVTSDKVDSSVVTATVYTPLTDLDTFANTNIQFVTGDASNAPVAGAANKFLVVTVKGETNGSKTQTAVQVGGSGGSGLGAIYYRSKAALSAYGAWGAINT